MPLTLTDIVNGAFIKLGVPPVESIDDDIVSARSAKLRWPAVRAHLLRLHLWKFAKSVPVILAPSGTPVTTDFSYYFNFPTECLRLCDLSEDSFLVEGRTILANTDTLVVRYIKDLEDTTQYDPCFAELCSTYLAADLAVQLTKELALKESLQEEFLKLLKIAKSIDSTESEPQCIDATLFLQSRLSGPTECCDGSSGAISFSASAAEALASDECGCDVFGFEGASASEGLVPSPGPATASRRVLYSDVGWDTAPSGGGSGGVVPSGTGFTHNTGGVQDGASKLVDLNSSDVTNKLPYSKFQDVSATDKVIGRSTAGAGVVEEITCTAAGRALIDDADAAAQRTTLGLGTAATQASTAFQAADATLTALASYNTNGVICQTAADTFAGRTITGTSNEINVTNGDGVAANPTLSLPSTIDLSGKTWFKLPAGTGPTVDASGKTAIDTNGDGANLTQGLLIYHDGTQKMYGVAVDTLPTTDDHALCYDGTNKKFVFQAQAGGGGSSPTTTRGDLIARGASADQRLGIGAVGAIVGSDGTDVEWLHPTTHAWSFEDFDHSNNSPYSHGWLSSGVGTGSQLAWINAEANHPGIVQLQTGTTNTGGRNIFRNTVSVLLGGGRMVYEWIARIPVLSDGTDTFTVRIGLGDNTTPTDGLHFEYTHGTNSGQWQGKATANSTSSTLSSSSAVAANTWYRLRIEVNAAAGSAEFFVNGTSIGTITSANIPSGSTNQCTPLCSILKSAGTTSRNLDLDTYWDYVKFTTAR